MGTSRPAIPRPLDRQVRVEEGHRCAIPTCRATASLEVHHIVPWSKVKEHVFENLILLCANCHGRVTKREIDTLSVKTYKTMLAGSVILETPASSAATDPVNPAGDLDEMVSVGAYEVVQRFCELVWQDQNLAGAWSLTDPLLRECWMQVFLHPIREQLENEGQDCDLIVQQARQSHPPDADLWAGFERIQLPALIAWGDLHRWSTGTRRRVVEPGVEVLWRTPTQPRGGYLMPGQAIEAHRFLARETDSGWRVLNISGDSIPRPGWPPVL